MRTLITLALALTLVAAVAAQDLGNKGPVKAPPPYLENIHGPIRQGGDTIATATIVPGLPYCDSGTTVGYANDYEEVCPYSGSTAPDVVYSFVAGSTVYVDIDLCGSSYDTKLYVYDAGMALIACNDDFYFGAPCGTYVSNLENMTFNAGGTYYIIVDGYGGASGDYVLSVGHWGLCPVECPDDGLPEGEPPLVDNYVDNWNGGCNTNPVSPPFQVLQPYVDGNLILCGVSGWYTYQGSNDRDTDWYILHMGEAGIIEIEIEAEFDTYIFELGPQDCDAIGVLQLATATYCEPDVMTVSGYANGAPVWFWVGPTVFAPPAGADDEYDYVVQFTGLVVETQGTTWSTVKALYD